MNYSRIATKRHRIWLMSVPRNSPTRLDAWRCLLEVHAHLVKVLDAELVQAHDLDLDRYDALVHLHEAGGAMRMTALADRLVLSRSATTRFGDRLEDEGLVERRSCPSDRRGTELVLTELGRRRLAEASRTHLRGVRQHFGRHLGDDQAAGLVDALRSVLAASRPALDRPQG